MGKEKDIDSVGLDGILYQTATEASGVFIEEGYGFVRDTNVISQDDWTKYMKPYRTADFQIIMVKDGIGKLQLNMQEVVIQQGDVIVLKPGVLVMQDSFSESINVGIVAYSGNLQEWIMQEPFGIIHPTGQNLENINNYFGLIEQTLLYQPKNKLIIEPLIISLLYYCGDLCKNDDSRDVRKRLAGDDRNQELFKSFMQLLNTYGKQEHKIPFYAEQLNITPNYLNSIVRKVSGETMNHWIDLLLVSEAKAALAYSTMTVQQISDALSFSTVAFFCKFFKKQTGMTPMEYRKS